MLGDVGIHDRVITYSFNIKFVYPVKRNRFSNSQFKPKPLYEPLRVQGPHQQVASSRGQTRPENPKDTRPLAGECQARKGS